MNWRHPRANVTERTSSFVIDDDEDEGGHKERKELGGVSVCPSLRWKNDPLEGQRGRTLGVEGLYFHCLTEHRHGEDQTQDLHRHNTSWG